MLHFYIKLKMYILFYLLYKKQVQSNEVTWLKVTQQVSDEPWFVTQAQLTKALLFLSFLF